jgi:hypothetical protein
MVSKRLENHLAEPCWLRRGSLAQGDVGGSRFYDVCGDLYVLIVTYIGSRRQIEEWTILKRKSIEKGPDSFPYRQTGSPFSPISLHRQAVPATLTEERLRKK